jgi:hypothetical protein
MRCRHCNPEQAAPPPPQAVEDEDPVDTPMVATNLSDETIVTRILKAVGKPVSFQYPGNEGCKHGILRERAVVSSPSSTSVPYWDVVDLIEFQSEAEQEWIRIGYYRKPKDSLVWGSQTTITEPVSVWKRLLVHAAREKAWFMKLLQDVIAELQEKHAEQAAADRPRD